jgi:hypothetical protein
MPQRLSGFVGGGGFGVAVGFAGGVTGVGWFPLGPRDVWVPGYRCSQRYVQNVNVTNTRIVTVTQVTNVYNNYTVNRTVNVNEYAYARNVSAVTVVDRETFVNARPVARATIRVPPEQFEKARVVENAPLAPTRNSYVAATAKPVPASRRPATSFNDRKVVAKLPPPIPAAGGHESRIVTSEKPERTAEPNPRAQANNTESNSNARANNNRPEDRTTLTPPARENPKASNEQQQREYQQHPAVKYTPATKAKDEMYDVHPPLNRNAPPKQEERRAEAPQKEKQESHPSKEEHHDSKQPK